MILSRILELQQGYTPSILLFIGVMLLVPAVYIAFLSNVVESVLPFIAGCCIGPVGVVLLTMGVFNETTARNDLEAAIQEDVLENFSIQEISVKYGTSEFLNLNTENPGDDEEPVVFVVAFHHEDGAVTDHEMLYHVEQDIMVPLQHEAAEVQHVLQPGSKLDTLLQEHSAHL